MTLVTKLLNCCTRRICNKIDKLLYTSDSVKKTHFLDQKIVRLPCMYTYSRSLSEKETIFIFSIFYLYTNDKSMKFDVLNNPSISNSNISVQNERTTFYLLTVHLSTTKNVYLRIHQTKTSHLRSLLIYDVSEVRSCFKFRSLWTRFP